MTVWSLTNSSRVAEKLRSKVAVVPTDKIKVNYTVVLLQCSVRRHSAPTGVNDSAVTRTMQLR